MGFSSQVPEQLGKNQILPAIVLVDNSIQPHFGTSIIKHDLAEWPTQGSTEVGQSYYILIHEITLFKSRKLTLDDLIGEKTDLFDFEIISYYC